MTSRQFGERGGIVAVAVSLLWAACGPGPANRAYGTDVGTISLVLTAAPAEVLCVRVSVNADERTTRLFPVTPGQSQVLTVPGIPSGLVTVGEEAFALGCTDVKDDSPANWVNEKPVTAVVVAKQTVTVALVLRPTGSIQVQSDFDDGGLIVDDTSADFGSVTLGSTSSTLSVALRNVGTSATGTITATIAGPAAAQFTITSVPCTLLAAAQSCTATLSFRPTGSGVQSAALIISANPGGLATVGLAGRGMTPAMLLATPASADFGAVAANANSATIDIVVRNAGQSPASNLTNMLQATSAVSLPFHYVSDGCTGATLAPNATCTVSLRAVGPVVRAATVATGALVVGADGGILVSVPLQVTSR